MKSRRLKRIGSLSASKSTKKQEEQKRRDEELERQLARQKWEQELKRKEKEAKNEENRGSFCLVCYNNASNFLGNWYGDLSFLNYWGLILLYLL